MRNYNIITKNEYMSRFPNNDNYDIDLMTEGLQQDFFKLYSFYYYLMEKYIIEKLSLDFYDNYFKESNLKYKNVDSAKMDIYQKMSSDLLSYFYIRNNLYLNRLDKIELEFLKEKMNSNSLELDEKTIGFLNNTMKKVIIETKFLDGEFKMVNFGPPSPQYYAPVNALVLGFRYDEFNQSNNETDEEWDLTHTKQRNDIKNKLIELREKVANEMDIPVSVIEYNDFSVRKI